MHYKVGDVVKFLNETGGGRISRIINSKMVSVCDEDGFEIPVLMSDIVVVSSDEVKEPKTYNQIKKTTSFSIENQKEFPITVEDKVTINDIGIDFETFMAIVPTNEKDITNCDLNLFLINDSTYNMLYTVSLWLEKGETRLLSKNDLEPDSKDFIYCLSRTDLATIKVLQISFLLYKQTRNYEPHVPEQINLELHPLRFVKQGSFEENDFFDEKAVIYKIAANLIEKQTIEINPKELEKSIKEKKDIKPSNKVTNTKKQNIEEIDLHIENLVSNPKELDNAEILEIQKARFITALDLGIASNTKRMIFIHGIGNGKLKYEIRRLLDTQYAVKVRYQDASFKEYGYGATMVIL